MVWMPAHFSPFDGMLIVLFQFTCSEARFADQKIALFVEEVVFCRGNHMVAFFAHWIGYFH